MSKLYDYAQKLIHKLKHKKISNCKELAKRLVLFEIKELIPKIEENLKKLEEFLYESYKGFYCAICNYNNTPFFDKSNNKIIFSEKFCRDIVENTLPTLKFFTIDINKYSNLISKFLLSCDSKGDYLADVPVPTDYLFLADETDSELLEGCKNERNSSDWFLKCEGVC